MPKAEIKYYENGKIKTRIEDYVAMYDERILGIYAGPDDTARCIEKINMDGMDFISVRWLNGL